MMGSLYGCRCLVAHHLEATVGILLLFAVVAPGFTVVNAAAFQSSGDSSCIKRLSSSSFCFARRNSCLPTITTKTMTQSRTMTLMRRYSQPSSDSVNPSQVVSSVASTVIPRAAVSVCVKGLQGLQGRPTSNSLSYKFLLIQRGKPPYQGRWSLPGGKVEYGETTLTAARRELWEETGLGVLPPNSLPNSIISERIEVLKTTTTMYSLAWYNGTAMAVDSIGPGFHFLIAQCYAELHVEQHDDLGDNIVLLPTIQARDDAADARWFHLSELQTLDETQQTTPGLYDVVTRIDALSRANLLPTDVTLATRNELES